MVCGASAWFGAYLADSDSEETELLKVFAVNSECLAGVTASEVAEEAWGCVEGLGCGAPVATPNLSPIEGVVVVGSGGSGAWVVARVVLWAAGEGVL